MPAKNAMSRLPKPWGAFLSDLDAALPAPVELHCMGGFVLAAVYAVPRTTGDLDYLAAIPNQAATILEGLGGQGSSLAAKHKVSLQRVGVADCPENYDSRLSELHLGLKNLRLMVLDPYDLILSKLTRNSPKDREDIKFLARDVNLESAKLRARFDNEMKPWLPNLVRHELTLKLWSEFFPA